MCKESAVLLAPLLWTLLWLRSRKSPGGLAEPRSLMPVRARSAEQIIRRRRSAVAMDGSTSLDRGSFYQMLARTLPTGFPFHVLPWRSYVSLAVFALTDEEDQSPDTVASYVDGAIAAARPGSANWVHVVRGKAAHAGRELAEGRNAVLAAAALATLAPVDGGVLDESGNRTFTLAEDALSGVEAGRRGNFALVIGVDRIDQAAALAEHGADVVVSDLAEIEVDTGATTESSMADLPSAFADNAGLPFELGERRLAVFLDDLVDAGRAIALRRLVVIGQVIGDRYLDVLERQVRRLVFLVVGI